MFFSESRPKLLIDSIQDDAGLFPIKQGGKANFCKLYSSVFEIKGSSAWVRNEVLKSVLSDLYSTLSKTLITGWRPTANFQAEK